ncbi:hypothetical protein COW80_02360 [Candidatus Beckwithbacteria bacterium CG22_combo_CG10-13_8_21_14_all_01_47_9]|uniref:Vitamin K epoxide reductase domain-containing protein n=4 Tax=Candidatus Beckwithiibacteriota TaxID=1752726 RepID=A0A2H0E106_9BACT|nr:MAG: hypothetical protein AUJ59_02690 [Candidatus Beckwithbacteria bacterium CG1_02_47_37]PIP88105.1 MAG: hypothetical protein COW80_02360 [Candidatus Beckwithbacteria bacterium CG22_combo_CG10-13_8_21_14_all_01_47_9]PJA22217.1 MAG: hypothetical protein COX59_03225 [Candidatus Beckwithbacteria bacterium CG_4_10_14_0_2_um_filter_47_25]PJC66755.1 MAG: hypothetical protein CO018_00160 [Candidatus Beckwithbacteria bacterium CG_4_9_14_0_2_um_filter_47_11]
MDKLFKLSAGLAAFGILLASYLFYSYLAPTPPGWCDISTAVNCDAVTKGPLAEFLGVPVSLVGLIGYITILYASLMKFKKLHLFMVSFGMIFCLRLTYLEIFRENVFCPVCGACQLVMLILFIISLKLNRRHDPILARQ